MKKINKIFGVCLMALPMACTGNYLDINTNPFEVSEEDMATDGYAISSALSAIASTVISTDVNTAQFTDCLLGGPLGRYYSSTIGSETTVDNNNATDDWTKVLMTSDHIIPKLYTNHKQIQSLTKEPVVLAVADIIKVAAMHRVTDTFGPIPYSKIGQDGKIAIEYDSQEQVYDKFFEELDNAIKVLTENQMSGFSPKVDPVFDGTPLKWCRFANSLKLRLAMRIVYAAPEKARKYAEEAASHPLGLISSNDDNAMLKPVQFGDKGNPLYTAIKYNQVTGTNTGGDSHVAADITTYMNGYKDPRREKYFISSLFEGDENKYVGMRIGIVRPSLTTSSHKYSGINIAPSDPLLWMNASEVCFLKAEAASIFGFNMGSGTPEEFYNEGIRLSFKNWGAPGVEAYISDDELKPGSYTDPLSLNSYSSKLSTITIKWDDAATPEEKQERILIQKWIANYNLGLEAWSDFRRTGYPKFIPATKEGNQSFIVDNTLGPRRMPYPQQEYTNNRENILKACNEYLNGKDNMVQRVWWDCNPATIK